MARRSGRSLTFKDAVRLLDDGSAFVRDLDELIEHAFDAVPVAGPLLGLPYFAFRRKLVEYGERVVRGIRDRVDGVGRYDRTQRLHAAHAVIVMTGFAEALGEILDGADLQVERNRGTARVSDAHGTLVLMYGELDTLDPGPSRIQWIEPLYVTLTQDVSRLLHTWGLDDTDSLVGELPGRARRRYEEHFRGLAAEIPEFQVWAYLAEHAATQAAVREADEDVQAVGDAVRAVGDELHARLAPLTTGLAAVPELLAEVSGHAAANRVRTGLASAYQAVLRRSVLGETHAPDGVVLPTLERGYVNPAACAAVIGSNDRPSEDHWWADQPRYDDIQSLLIGELTAPYSVHCPLVILGQPGAGKSVLTRILSARLSDRGFLPVRVELRNVPADVEIQIQVEHAIRATTGRSIDWPDLAEEARDDGLLPLIILDGFDELLQATGVNRSDYLEQVVRFQQREFDQGRPVAAIVTSRTAVADRARFPEATTALRIEPFDEARVTTWLDVWNESNGWSLDAETILRYGELAEQPLLLTLLAMYDAGTGALSSTEAELSRAELYDRLLSEFARREVRKGDTGLDSKQEDRAVAAELHRLSIVALAMFNRHVQVITGAELDRDLAALLPHDDEPTRTGTGMAKPLTAAQLTVGRFFFVHESQAVRNDEDEHAYEFLHATFGEFLVARLVIETLRALARLRSFHESQGTPAPLDDGVLWTVLSFAALTGSVASVEFTEGMLCRLPGDERSAVRELAIKLLHGAQYPNPRRSRIEYEPEREPVFMRHAYYSANLTVLAVLSTGDPLEFHPYGMDGWRAAMRFEEFDVLRATVRVLAIPGEDKHEMRIVREDGSPVDPIMFGVLQRSSLSLSTDRLFAAATFPAFREAGGLIRTHAFTHDPYFEMAALLPYFEFIGDGVLDGRADGGLFVPYARVLLELRFAPFSAHGAAKREQIYRWCFKNLRDCSPALCVTILRQLREDIREFPALAVAELLCEVPLYDWQDNEIVDAFCDALSVLHDAGHQAAQSVVDHVNQALHGATPFPEELFIRINDSIA